MPPPPIAPLVSPEFGMYSSACASLGWWKRNLGNCYACHSFRVRVPCSLNVGDKSILAGRIEFVVRTGRSTVASRLAWGSFLGALYQLTSVVVTLGRIAVVRTVSEPWRALLHNQIIDRAPQSRSLIEQIGHTTRPSLHGHTMITTVDWSPCRHNGNDVWGLDHMGYIVISLWVSTTFGSSSFLFLFIGEVIG